MKIKILLVALTVVIAVSAVFFLRIQSNKPDKKSFVESGLTCSAYHSGANSPFADAKCLLPDGKMLLPGESISGYSSEFVTGPDTCGEKQISICQPGGKLSGPSELFPTCSQFCIHPRTAQPVRAGTVYASYSKSAGLKSHCQNSKLESRCSPETGEFLPEIPESSFGFCAVLQAEGAEVLHWSDPSTWGGALPVDGADIIIPDGKIVILDNDTPALSSLHIDGILVSANRDVTLTAGVIYMAGALQIGSPTAPFTHKFKIRVTKPKAESGLHQGFFMMSGGQFDAHGIALTEAEKAQGNTRYPWGTARFSNINLEVSP